MLSGVSIVCFASSYAVALALEAARLVLRRQIRGVFVLGWVVAGLLAHSIYLANEVHRSWQGRIEGSPLSSERDWYLLAAWAMAVVCLGLIWGRPKTPFGLFLLPPVLALVGVARFVADPKPFPRESASKIWGMIHGSSILLATVAVLVGLVAGLMYLGQVRRLKHKRPAPGWLPLPSLEWLQKVNARSIVVAVVMLGVGIVSGILLNLISKSGHVPWSDPVVLSTMAMFGWLVIACGIGLVSRSAREGRKVAYLTILSFLFLVLALVMVLSVQTQHGGPRRTAEPGVREGAT